MDNKELYHYGVPGMRWGQRKAVDQVPGRNTRTAVNQQTTNNKPRKSQSSNRKPQAKKQQPQEQQQTQDQNTATEKQSSNFKKGLIAAGVALAIIGTFLIARKIGQNSMQTPEVEKKVSNGKKAVDKMKNKKVVKKPADNWKEEARLDFERRQQEQRKINERVRAAKNKAHEKELAETMKKTDAYYNQKVNRLKTAIAREKSAKAKEAIAAPVNLRSLNILERKNLLK